jgi:hypothetical protein
MKTRSQARLKIIGTGLGPEAITSQLGLRPDRVRRAGEVRPRTTIVEKTDLWEIHSDVPEDYALAEHIESVLRKISPVAERIKDIARSHAVLLSCIVHSPSEPALALNQESIQLLAKIQGEVDFDLYIGDEDPPGSKAT